jgi:hypothetical protein
MEYDLLSRLIKLYKELVDMYFLDLLFKWPVYPALQDIQGRLAEIIPPVLYDTEDKTYTKDEQKDIDFLHSIMLDGSHRRPN